ncbi:thiamine pyrophosphate-dependent enzyme [Salinarimonas ramus]|uniref:Acetolactate synthase n=1 Tax=Salinarimonas ramus TaxID=690164 RepID=A0A917V2J4_9HYPH|nr:thiamine pyrophosphate-dependent enzyme [Salinarimonas ramus]GGK23509.1 acetolactate synthase [Salinarimonas ramus]
MQDERAMERLSGAEALARMLQAHGAGPIFLSGGLSSAPLDGALVELGLAHAPIVDARAAAFAADAYAQASGRVGLVSLARSALVAEASAGLLAAREAGSPVLAILPEPDALDATILAGSCKETIRVARAADVPGLVRRAFIAATTGRPGPVALVVPEAVRAQEADVATDDLVEHGRFEAASALRARPDLEALNEAAERLAGAERPLVLAGPDVHVSRAAKALQELAEAQSLPVAHTPGGIGAVACTGEIAAGLVRPGGVAAKALAEADLVIAIGGALDELAARHPELVGFPARVIALEAQAEAIGRVRAVDVPLWGDPRAGIEALAHVLDKREAGVPEARAAWAASLAAARAEEREAHAARLASTPEAPSLARLVALLDAYMPADGLLLVEPGAVAEAAHRGFTVKRCGRGLLVARGPAAEGAAFPAALGAALAVPGRVVVALAGERGATRAIGILESARRLGVPINLVVADTSAAQGAADATGEGVPAELAETRFDRAAEGLGCMGRRAQTLDEMASSLEEVLSFRDGPALLDVKIANSDDLDTM